MEAPQLQASPGACDCHIHVFEDRYPLAPTATFKPPHCTGVRLQQRSRRPSGLERGGGGAAWGG